MTWAEKEAGVDAVTVATFGTDATFTPAGLGTAETVRGILDDGALAEGISPGNVITFTAQVASFSNSPEKGQLTVDQRIYDIVRVERSREMYVLVLRFQKEVFS